MSTLQVNNITGLSVGGLPDGIITTDDIAAGAVTASKRSEDLTLETAKSATGTSVPFTGIPSWVKRITVMMNNVSFSSTTNAEYLMVQIGDSGGIETSGYGCYAIFTAITGQNSIDGPEGFIIYSTPIYVNNASGALTLNNLSGNTWVSTHEFARIDNVGSPNGCRGAGSKTLSDTLTQLRITTLNGTGTFTTGTINIMYE